VGPPPGGAGGGPPAGLRGVLLIASFAPFDADGLDYVEGMGAQNIAQFEAARRGESAMRETVAQMASAVRGHPSAEVATQMASLLPPADVAVLTGPYGADNSANMDHGLSGGDEGWIADLTALTNAWGFDLATITAPIELWHGTADQMVPVTHGRWLAEHLSTARVHLEPGHGHLSLVIGSLGDKLEALS
jgi:pimeloyl-ACP methyl ester carboxylesterase